MGRADGAIWTTVVALLASATCAAQTREGELSSVTLNGDTGIISASIDVDGTPAGDLQFKIKKVEITNNEVLLRGPLFASTDGNSQTVGVATMRLTDANGVC
jgi:hypothetical protein